MNGRTANTPDQPIRVTLRVDDCPQPMTVAVWSDWVDTQLAKAGIPIDDGLLLRGSLTRFDDHNDFGATIWIWTP